MKLSIRQAEGCKEAEVEITYGVMDETLELLIEQVKLFQASFIVKHDGITKHIPLRDIYYFDAVDNKTFLYLKEDTYSCSQKLYELEGMLVSTPFVRISKSCILNVGTVDSVKAQISGRLEGRAGSDAGHDSDVHRNLPDLLCYPDGLCQFD